MDVAHTENTTISKRVRRMFGLDLDAWNVVMVSFLGVAAIAAVVVGLSTAIIIKLQKQSELESNERIASLVTQGDQLRKDTAEANNRTKEAELKLLELRKQQEPRIINGDIFLAAMEGRPKAKVELLYVAEDPESYSLALQIGWWLMDSGWEHEFEKPIPPREPDSPYPDKPLSWSVLAFDTGVTIIPSLGTKLTLDEDTPFAALANALLKTLGQGQVRAGLAWTNDGPQSKIPTGTLRVVVAPKPSPAIQLDLNGPALRRGMGEQHAPEAAAPK
jgi:hypothetical protein